MVGDFGLTWFCLWCVFGFPGGFVVLVLSCELALCVIVWVDCFVYDVFGFAVVISLGLLLELNLILFFSWVF